MTPREMRRLYLIIRMFLIYGLDELIPKIRLTLPLRMGRYLFFWLPHRHKDKPLGERMRLALEQLAAGFESCSLWLTAARGQVQRNSLLENVSQRLNATENRLDIHTA